MIFLSIPFIFSSIINISAIEEAASHSQLKFALDSKYDDTGPGAKQTETAYKTYRNIDNVIIGYLDDPDTKLPERDRARAFSLLSHFNHRQDFDKNYNQRKPPLPFKSLVDIQPKFNVVYPGVQKETDRRHYIKHPIPLPNRHPLPVQPHSNYFETHTLPETKVYSDEEKVRPPAYDIEVHKPDISNTVNNYSMRKPFHDEPRKYLKKNKPGELTLSHYKKQNGPVRDGITYNANPQYNYAYGVHDAQTGDSKYAQERRDGDKVSGEFSFIDANGHRRTIIYTVDKDTGFNAVQS